ncbi:hypothetical protein AA21952_2922 [Acetobacter oeni LMG 21952]|nr:hypothetical protein AA21952_2922 [Acetobacter oeni LMG 21952]
MTGFFEGICRKTGTTIGQNMGNPERKGSFDGLEEIDGIIGILRVIDGQMHRTGASIDGDIEKTFPPFSIRCLQFWQMFHIDMDIAGIVIPELSLSTHWPGLWSRRQSVQSSIFQNTPDIVPFQMRQEMPHDEGQIIQAKTGRTPKLTDNGALFLRGFPGEFPRAAAAIPAGV